MKIYINQQQNGMWVLRTFESEHITNHGEPAHLTGREVFKSSRQAKKLTDPVTKSLLKEFKKVNDKFNFTSVFDLKKICGTLVYILKLLTAPPS